MNQHMAESAAQQPEVTGVAEAEALEDLLVAFYQHEKAQQEIPLEQALPKLRQGYPEPVPARPWWHPLVWVGAPAALAAMLVFLVLPDKRNITRAPGQKASVSQKFLLLRGGPAPMQVVRKRKQEKGLVHSGETFLQGDQLRLLLRWKKGGFVRVLHRDPKGSISPLYPKEEKGRALQLNTTARTPLPGQLDVTDAPQGDEEIWACFSTKPVSHAQVVATIEKHNAQSSHIHKQAGPCAVLQRFRLHRPQEKP